MSLVPERVQTDMKGLTVPQQSHNQHCVLPNTLGFGADEDPSTPDRYYSELISPAFLNHSTARRFGKFACLGARWKVFDPTRLAVCSGHEK
jgi:hypothetical protein